MRKLADYLFFAEGSSRSAALLRVFIACVCLAKYAYKMGAWHDTSPTGYLETIVFVTLVCMVFVGFMTRFASMGLAVFGVWLYHFRGVAGEESFFLHHHTAMLLTGIVALALMDSGRSFSVDRWLALRHAEHKGEEPPPERTSLVGHRVIAIQLAITYAWAAYTKAEWSFLNGDRLDQVFAWYYLGGDLWDPWWWGVFTLLCAVGTVGIELLMIPALFVHRVQKWIYPLGIAMHLGFYFMVPVSVYTATVLAMLIVTLDPQRVHDGFERMMGHRSPAPP